MVRAPRSPPGGCGEPLIPLIPAAPKAGASRWPGASWQQAEAWRGLGSKGWSRETVPVTAGMRKEPDSPKWQHRGAWGGRGSSARIHHSGCPGLVGNSQSSASSLRSWEPAAPARNSWDEHTQQHQTPRGEDGGHLWVPRVRRGHPMGALRWGGTGTGWNSARGSKGRGKQLP